MIVESTAGGDLFDSLPDQCPGCGVKDTPAEDGPSRLMFIWVWRIDSYLCLTCNGSYSTWIGTNWAPEIIESTGLDLRATNKPKCVKNVERIAAGEEPDYKSWQFNNPMGMGYCPPVS